jgi:hypothetical protein
MTNRPRPARFRPFTVAVLALMPFAAGAAPWAACPVEEIRPAAMPEHDPDARFGGLPEAPANPVGCLFGLPLQVDAHTVLWRCLVDAELQETALDEHGELAEYADDDGRISEGDDPRRWSHALLVLRDGEPVQAFRDELMAGMFGAWSLRRVDLDGDGRAENLVALWNGQGNGLGVNRWTLRVFSADWTPLDARAGVADWGASSLRAAPAPRPGCDLATTEFVEDTSTGTDGIAFEARFLRLQDGRLVAADDQPPVRRRYTFAFQNQRTAWFEEDEDRLEGDPADWLRGATP